VQAAGRALRLDEGPIDAESFMRGRPLPSAVHRIGPHAPSAVHLFKLIRPSKDPYPVAVPPAAKSIVSTVTIVNVPVAPANRPVPFSIVALSVRVAVVAYMLKRRTRHSMFIEDSTI